MIIQVYCFSPKPGKLHLRAAGKTSVHAQNSAPPGADKHRRRYIITENVIHRPRNKYFLFLAGYVFPTAYHFPSCLCLYSVFPAQDPPFSDATVGITRELAAYLNYRQHGIRPRLAPLQKETSKVITHGYTQRIHVFSQTENQEPSSPPPNSRKSATHLAGSNHRFWCWLVSGSSSELLVPVAEWKSEIHHWASGDGRKLARKWRKKSQHQHHLLWFECFPGLHFSNPLEILDFKSRMRNSSTLIQWQWNWANFLCPQFYLCSFLT